MGCSSSKVPDGPDGKANRELTPETLIEFPFIGVSVSAVEEFIDENGGVEEFSMLNTVDVLERFILPLTSKSNIKTSYVQLLSNDLRGHATIFVSHCHSSNFLVVFQIIKDFLHCNGIASSSYLWMDIFCFNQHYGFDSAFLGKFPTFEHSILVVPSLQDLPSLIRRTWILAEIFLMLTAIESTTSFDMVTFIQETEALQDAIVVNSLPSIDIDKSKTSNSQDKSKISQFLARTCGSNNVFNNKLSKMLFEWKLELGKKRIAACDDVEENCSIMQGVACLLMQTEDGKVEAERMLRIVVARLSDKIDNSKKCKKEGTEMSDTKEKELEFYRGNGESDINEGRNTNNWESRTESDEDEDEADEEVQESELKKLSVMSSLSSVLWMQDKIEEVEPLIREIAITSEKLCGECSTEALSSALTLGVFLKTQGKYDEAEPLIENVLAKQKRMFGSDHRDTLHTTLSLADLNESKGNLIKAESLYRVALQSNVESSQPKRQQLSTINKLVLVLKLQGKQAETIDVYRETLTHKELSPLEKLNALTCLATELTKNPTNQEQPLEIENLLREALHIRRATFGDNDFSTLSAQVTLVHYLAEQSKIEEAESLQKGVVSRLKDLYGISHRYTIKNMQTLASLLERLGREAECGLLLREIDATEYNIDDDNHSV